MKTKWHKVTEFPTRKTRYAHKFGVPILGFDKNEFIDSGSCDPFDVHFNFKKKQFEQLAFGNNKSIWIPAEITHWTELPEIPIRRKING